MARLFVIEAPGKKRTFEALLKDLGEDAIVQATGGHLFEMPRELAQAGVDSAFRDFGRKPRDMRNVEWLRRQAGIAEDVVVATDADLEGDAIAWDVATLIRDMHPNLRRMRLRGMDRESVREALTNLTPVSKADAVPARTRAIVDRLIGVGYSGGGVAVGRIQTAILGLARNSEPGTSIVRLVAPAKDGGRPYRAECAVAGPITPEVAGRLVEVEFPALSHKGTKPAPRKPGHMGDVLVRAGDVMDISPSQAARAMQRTYEAGRLSYPRAGTRAFSPTVAAKMAEVLRKAGYGGVAAANFGEKSEAGVHDAPHPIGKVELHHDPRTLGDDEGVRAVIARDLVRAGQSHVREDALTAPIGPFLVSKGFHPAVATHVASLDWNRENGPRYPGQESWPESEVVQRRPDTVLLERAMAAGLGKPSTWPDHIAKFMERGLVDDNLALTAKGRAWAEASPQELLDPRVSMAIERACERFHPSYMEDASREPWELNAERICNALPPRVREVVSALVDAEAPRPKLDPIEAYGLATDFAAEAERAARPAYAPADAD